jgi:hypothetical protein
LHAASTTSAFVRAAKNARSVSSIGANASTEISRRITRSTNWPQSSSSARASPKPSSSAHASSRFMKWPVDGRNAGPSATQPSRSG